MQKFPGYIILSVLMLLAAPAARAQEKPFIKSSVDKNQILIGEPIRFIIEVRSPMVSGNQLPQLDSIPHFEMIEKANRDSTISAEGASYHLEWKITSFDSGTHVIPAFPLVVGHQLYRTDSIAVEVSYGEVDTTRDYHDIRGIIDVPNADMKYVPWFVGAVCLLSLAGFIWVMRKPLAAKPEPVAVPFHPKKTDLDEALQSLEKLKYMLREDPGAVKKFYTGLHDTLRVYLNRHFGLVTMEKTSEEVIHMISDLKPERDMFTRLSTALRMGDFVKFAKYIPGPYENEENLEIIRSSIKTINEIQR